jgi:CarD family transcriptional regulator
MSCGAWDVRTAARMPHRQELFEQVPMKSATAGKSALSSDTTDMTETLEREPADAALEVEDAEGVAAAAAEPEDEEEEQAATPAPRARAANDTPSPGHHMMGRSQAIAPGGRVMPPPRAMAKAEIFEEGDHVVYPTHGVGKVERIATEEIAGHKLELIHITFEENRMTLRVPVAKARTAGLRKLATRKMFDEALAVLKGRARIKRTMWSRRAQEYEAKINSGDPLAIAEVVRDLHRNAGQPDQSFSERQIYEAAMDRLAAELAALDRIDKATAAVKLAEFLKTVA